MMVTPNLRLVSHRDHLEEGRWYIRDEADRLVVYAKRLAVEYQAEEPSAGWHLETKGIEQGWHDLAG